MAHSTHTPPAARGLSIRLLGNFDVRVDGRLIDDADWHRRHARQLIKHLALAPARQLHREQLLELLWPGVSPDRAGNNLNKSVFLARHALEPGLSRGSDSRFLQRHGEYVSLHPGEEGEIDAIEFENLANEALRTDDAELLAQAANACAGELLPDDVYDDCIRQRRDALRSLHGSVLDRLAGGFERQDEYTQAVPILQKLASLDPLNEARRRRLMAALVSSGQRSLALQHYKNLADALAQELGMEPDAETRQLYNDILASVVRAEWTDRDTRHATEHDTVVAIMPFDVPRPDATLDYIGEGMTEQLIYRVSRLAEMRVMARSTSYRFRQQQLDPLQLKSQWHVSRVIFGRIDCIASNLKVWVEIVDTATGLLHWAEFFDRPLDELPGLQQQIAEAVIASLTGSKSRAPQVLRTRRDTHNSPACHEYLKGRFYWNKRDADSLARARTHFQAAIELDPIYALAYSGLADCYNVASLYAPLLPSTTMPRARAAARQALTIDADLAEAHTSLGYYYTSYAWNMAAAEAEFLRALALDDSYPTCYQWYHKLLIACGRFDDAARCIDKALAFDPLSSMIATERAWGLYHARQYDRAGEQLLALLREEPDFRMARFVLALIEIQSGEPLAAKNRLQQLLDTAGTAAPFLLGIGVYAFASARCGEEQATREALNRVRALDASTAPTAFAEALVHSALEQYDDALGALQRAIDERNDRMIFLAHDPLFDELRDHPGFAPLLDRVQPLKPAV